MPAEEGLIPSAFLRTAKEMRYYLGFREDRKVLSGFRVEVFAFTCPFLPNNFQSTDTLIEYDFKQGEVVLRITKPIEMSFRLISRVDDRPGVPPKFEFRGVDCREQHEVIVTILLD